MSDLLRFEGIEPEVEVRSESEREIAIRFMKYGEIGRTADGLEMFERSATAGAFEHVDPLNVILRTEHEGPPAGRGIRIEDRADSAIIIGKAAPTPRGDELLTLAREGYYKGASPSFAAVEGGTKYRTIGRDRVTVRNRVDLREVSLTWRPTYQGTEVLYARTQMEEGNVTDDTAQGAVNPDVPPVRGVEIPTTPEDYADYKGRVEALEQRFSTSTDVEIPVLDPERKIPRGQWMQGALMLMDGQSLAPLQQRELADTISSENPGFMPPQYRDEIIGIIDPARPFLNSIRRLDMPADGLSVIYPRITQRPTVGEQLTQKAEVSSQNVESDTITLNVRTFAGAGDLSLQLLRRSSPTFLNFYLELLAEAYATVTENAAVDALLAASPTAGTGTFDPGAPGAVFAEGFENAAAVGRTLKPDRIWLSTAALAAMMAETTPSGGGGTPMYPALAGIGGVSAGGTASAGINLQPVWVPALDDEAVDVIIGPSRGFGFAEEGTFTLQADVPGRLGRDVALGGFIVFVDLYPAAFTTYALGS